MPLGIQEEFVAAVGSALIEAVWGKGCRLIERFDDLWEERKWDCLVRCGWLAPEEGQKLALWVARDYRGLLARGVIDLRDCEYYESTDPARQPEG